MSKPYYPLISNDLATTIRTLRKQFDLHDDYLTRTECPYDEDILSILNLILVKPAEPEVVLTMEEQADRRAATAEEASAGGGKRGPKLKDGGIDADVIAEEIKDIREELKQLKIDGRALQTSDKIQIIKTRAALVEKLQAMSERRINVSKMGQFMSTVMTIMDDLVEEDRRGEFMRRLEPFAKLEN